MNAPEKSAPAAGSGRPPEGTTLPGDAKPVGALLPPTRSQNLAALVLTIFFLAVIGIGGRALYVHTHRGGAQTPGGMMTGRASGTHDGGGATSATVPAIEINDLRVQFAGVLRNGQSELQIEFKDANGQLVDVGSVKFALDMNMPGMPMHSDAVATGAGGRYRAKLQPQMPGDWNATLNYNGPKGSGRKTFKVAVQ